MHPPKLAAKDLAVLAVRSPEPVCDVSVPRLCAGNRKCHH